MDENAHPQTRHVSGAVKRFRGLIPYILLGPISGPLTAGVVRNFRAGQRFLAGLYALAMLEVWIVLPLVAHNFAVAAAP